MLPAGTSSPPRPARGPGPGPVLALVAAEAPKWIPLVPYLISLFPLSYPIFVPTLASQPTQFGSVLLLLFAVQGSSQMTAMTWMAAAVGCTSLEEERISGDGGAARWAPSRECFLKNIANVAESEAQDGEFPDISHYEKDVSGFAVESVHSWSDLEESEGEASSMSEAAFFPELQTPADYKVEDWDKELEDSELSPYGPPSCQRKKNHSDYTTLTCLQSMELFGDVGDLPCGSFQENNLLALYSWREDSMYNPGCHHAACIAFTSPIRITETGQFDDAEE